MGSVTEMPMRAEPQPEKPKSKAQETIRSVDVDAVLARISLDMNINDVSGIEALALLCRCIRDLQKLYRLSSDNAVDVKALVFDDYTPPLNVPKRRRSSQSAERMRSLSAELELPLRKSSKIEYNFEVLDEAEDASDAETSIPGVAPYEYSGIGSDLAMSLVKRFYLKALPSLSLESYLERINHYTKPGSSVYVASSLYFFNVALGLKTTPVEYLKEDADGLRCIPRVPLMAPSGPIDMIPIEDLNVFRLVLTVIRIASKLIEDKNYKQQYYCKVCGLQDKEELFRLELGFLFLINFNLMVNEDVLVRHLVRLKAFHKNMRRYERSDLQ